MEIELLRLTVLLAMGGCCLPKQPEIGRGEIRVPRMFHADLGWVGDAPSDHERYLEMYRSA
jgi:hypothetical protein